MAGGLLQIATFGSQDIYLTGNPEITFFKIVYRRHTNFAVESIEVPFEDDIEWGESISATIPMSGDLISKSYLKIELPELDLKRVHTSTSEFLTNFNNAKDNYHTVQEYIRVMMASYRIALEDFEASNVIFADTLHDSIEQYFINGGGFNDIINAYSLLSHTYSESTTNIRTIASSFSEPSSPSLLKKTLMDKLDTAVIKMGKELDDYYYEMLEKERLWKDDTNKRVKIAWVDRIGHNIIEYIDVNIGGFRIDRHYGEWLTIWQELTESTYKDDLYNKMIGNVSSLVSFDRNKKPKYTIYLPLQFWFCRYNGLALPLIALQYTDVTIDVKFREFKDLVYLEKNEIIDIDGEEFTLEELGEEDEIDLNASLLIDYVFLDAPERRRFAKVSHEYLIDQVQMIEYKDISRDRLNVLLDFYHPIKEFIWTAQRNSYRENSDGFTKTFFDRFSLNKNSITINNIHTKEKTITTNHSGNIIKNSFIDFNGYTRHPQIDSTYYNKVQPYSYHSRSPQDGINVYSTSLYPEEHQPSGHCNMSRVSKGILGLEFESSVFNTDKLNFRIYARNINILRFIGGFAGLAYIS